MNIPSVLGALVTELVDTGALELVEGSDTTAVTAELVDALESQSGFAHLGSFVSRVLLASDHVVELYVDDRDIARLVSEVGR